MKKKSEKQNMNVKNMNKINTEKSPAITLNNRRLHKQNKQYIALSSQTKFTKYKILEYKGRFLFLIKVLIKPLKE